MLGYGPYGAVLSLVLRRRCHFGTVPCVAVHMLLYGRGRTLLSLVLRWDGAVISIVVGGSLSLSLVLGLSAEVVGQARARAGG